MPVADILNEIAGRIKAQGIDRDFGALIAPYSGLCAAVTNQVGKFVHVSDGYSRLVGYSKEELVGQSFGIVIPEPIRAFALAAQQSFHQEGVIGKTVPNRFTIQRKDGQRILIHVDAIRLIEDDGTTYKITIVTPREIL